MSITPQTLARKLCEVEQQPSSRLAAQFAEHPRLAEAIIAIEWWRRQPGGLDTFCGQLISYVGKHLMPAEFWEFADKSGRFSVDDAFIVWRNLPWWTRPSGEPCPRLVGRIESGAVENSATAREAGFSKSEIESFSNWLTAEGCFKKCIEEAPQRLQKLLLEFFADQSASFPFSLTEMNQCERVSAENSRQMENQIRRFAQRASIVKRIRTLREGGTGTDVLEEKDVQATPKPKPLVAPFVIAAGLPQLIIEFLDDYGQRIKAAIPETETTRMVYEALDYSWTVKRPVRVIGQPGFGKSESEINYCNAHPGRARIVHTPEGNNEAGLLEGIAEALGILVEKQTSQKLKGEIKYVLKHTRLMMVFDEATFLLPRSFSRSTSPRRLDLVRREIIDQGLPCVFSSTKEFERKLERFAKETGYESEQWTDRMSIPFVLPEKYQTADLKEIVMRRFPDFSMEQVSKIAGRAKQLSGNTRFVIHVAERAQYLATTNGRQAANFEDVENACSEIENGARPRKEVESSPTFETDSRREIFPAVARSDSPPILDPIKL